MRHQRPADWPDADGEEDATQEPQLWRDRDSHSHNHTHPHEHHHVHTHGHAPRTRGDARRRDLVQAAFDLLAERGFEGLRTRDVAARAGVNIATLHYYFPSKEDVVAGVRDFLSEQFMTVHAPGNPRGGTPLERLRGEFADVAFYLAEYPTLVTVQAELMLRSRRDPSLRPILQRLGVYWAEGIERIVRAGVRDGTFRPDLDPAVATSVITSFLAGVLYRSDLLPALFDFGAACVEIERWLRSPEGATDAPDPTW